MIADWDVFFQFIVAILGCRSMFVEQLPSRLSSYCLQTPHVAVILSAAKDLVFLPAVMVI
jgi:hypothetical protein